MALKVGPNSDSDQTPNRTCLCRQTGSALQSTAPIESYVVYKVLVLLSFCILPASLNAQRIDLSDDFNQLLQQVEAQLVLPVETDYKDIRPVSNPWMDYDFSIRSRKERMEIRYKISPYQQEDKSFYAPHVKAMRAALQLATNDEDALVSTIALSSKSLTEDYQADWGKLYTFQPKESFSHRNTCQMITLYRKGKGMIFLFFLFDKPPLQLDYRHLAINFKE